MEYVFHNSGDRTILYLLSLLIIFARVSHLDFIVLTRYDFRLCWFLWQRCVSTCFCWTYGLFCFSSDTRSSLFTGVTCLFTQTSFTVRRSWHWSFAFLFCHYQRNSSSGILWCDVYCIMMYRTVFFCKSLDFATGCALWKYVSMSTVDLMYSLTALSRCLCTRCCSVRTTLTVYGPLFFDLDFFVLFFTRGDSDKQPLTCNLIISLAF